MRPEVPIGLEITLRVGCPIRCTYCPQALLLSKYKGEREFTLESFKRAIEGGKVPLSRNLTFMGASEPFLCKDAIAIMRWALLERGHLGSISTTLHNATREDIDAVAAMRDRLTDTVLHTPADDGRMAGLKVDAAYVDLYAYALQKWRNNQDFVVQIFNSKPHPALLKVLQESGVVIPCWPVHDRAGLLSTSGGWIVETGRRTGPIPLCGKQFCGHLFPNGDVARCCNDYGLANVWGNLFTSTYYDIYHSQKFRDYIKALERPDSECPCRYCHDGFHQVNTEDRGKGYDLVGH